MNDTIARIDRTVMGVKCTVTIGGLNSAVIAQKCLSSVENFEQLWSRFIPTSDICRLNQSMGQPTWVSPHTVRLVTNMKAAHEATQGLFNPTLLPLQLAAGDTRSLIDNKVSSLPTVAAPQKDLDSILVSEDGLIVVPAGVSLDAGGIAKGLAADIVVSEAIQLGATSACVNLGGDLAINTGDSPGWEIDIMSPFDEDEVLDTVQVSIGGLATSSLNARNRNGQSIESHIFTVSGVQPRTTVGATVIASTGAWAEAWTKFAIVSEPHFAMSTLTNVGLAAMLVLHDGEIVTTNSWKGYTS